MHTLFLYHFEILIPINEECPGDKTEAIMKKFIYNV